MGGSKFVDGVLTGGLESEIEQLRCAKKLHPTESLSWLSAYALSQFIFEAHSDLKKSISLPEGLAGSSSSLDRG